jgi:GDP-L-fucose synthase
MNFANSKVLITGGTGLIGVALTNMLVKLNANITVVSLDDTNPFGNNVNYIKKDLREFKNCLAVCKNQDYIFHLAGIKGSPTVALKKPASFFVPTIQFNTNFLEAAFRSEPDHLLYTSSIGVYAPNNIFYENSVWSTFPSDNDKFAGWAKRMGELQLESYKVQYGFQNFSIIRPANVYGPYDNFDENNAMVIPSLIRRSLNSKKELVVWGDGTTIRDFIYSEDVARGMLMAVKNKISDPINLGSGTGISIKELVETILKLIPNKNLKIIWDNSKPSGDKMRVMDMKAAKKMNFKCEVSLFDGIQKTLTWYLNNLNYSKKKYNSFTETIKKN